MSGVVCAIVGFMVRAERARGAKTEAALHSVAQALELTPSWITSVHYRKPFAVTADKLEHVKVKYRDWVFNRVQQQLIELAKLRAEYESLGGTYESTVCASSQSISGQTRQAGFDSPDLGTAGGDVPAPGSDVGQEVEVLREAELDGPARSVARRAA